MRGRLWIALALVVSGCAAGSGASFAEARGRVTVVLYDSFEKPGGYSLSDYQAKWATPYGLGEMTLDDTREFDNDTFSVSAIPFRTSTDASVFDHIKYFARSSQTFPVPEFGSVSFAATITAETPGTEHGHVVTGRYLPWTSHPHGKDYSATVLEGQQAGATLHMIDFSTGQLFDWFVSGSTAMTLIERLPSSVTGSTDHVGRDEMYTQIIREVPLAPGRTHTVEILYKRTPHGSSVEYLLDGKVVSQVERVGVPLDVQGVPYTGIYPSLGPGEVLREKVNAVTIGHGLFSLLDAFPFQHPEVPEGWVSIPRDQRLFGQGASARFDDVVVRTVRTGRD